MNNLSIKIPKTTINRDNIKINAWDSFKSKESNRHYIKETF